MLATTPLAFALVLNGAVAAAFAIYAWPRRTVPGARPFIFINLLAMVSSWSYAAHFQATSEAAGDFWLRVRFTGQAGLPLGVLFLALALSDHAARLSRSTTAGLAALPGIFILLMWTNPWHHLFLKDTPAAAPLMLLQHNPGPAFWLAIAYAAFFMMLGVLVLLDHAMRRGGVARRQALIILAGLAAPMVATAASFVTSAAGGLLLGPFAYSITLPLFALAIFRLGFLDIVPIARAAVFEEIGEGVIVLDETRRVVDANGAAARFLGINGPLVRRHAADLLAGWPELLDALTSGGRATLETGRGAYGLRAVVSPLSAAVSAPGYLVMIHDVTETRRTEAALQEASRARGDFIARMSHEIRTPMNGVMGLSGLLLQTPLDERQREYARGVRQSAQSLLRIVNDVLDFSRIDAGRLTLEVSDFEPRQSLADALDLVRPEADAKGLTLHVETDADVPFTVAGDAGRLRQVLINLLGNAVKFTHTGGVTVHAGSERTGQAGDDLLLRFTVSDTGIGMAPDVLERIFDPFVQAETTTASRYGGTGLGLAICRQLVDLMDGRIDARSEKSRGSTFVFTVRVARAGTAPARLAAEIADEAAPTRQWTGRVLVAEDNPVNQMVIVRMLDTRGLVADVAATGIEAVELSSRVPYDLILMDCRMPDMDGYEAARELRRREEDRRHTPIVAMTANALPADRQRCLDAGMDEHVAKPVRSSDLDAVLARFLPAAAVLAPIPAIDGLRAAMGGGFDTVVGRYLADAGESLETLRDAAGRCDGRAIEHVAHRLKGSSGVLGAEAMVRMCQALVEDPRQPGERLDALATELERVRTQLLAAVTERSMTVRRSGVLLADDHEVVRLGLRTLIDAQPDLRVVAEAGTGPEAVATFLEVRPDIGVIDLVLPGDDGATVCEAIRRASPRARLLIVSGSSGSEHVHRALKAGAQGYLLKHSPPAVLLSGIRDVLAGKRVVPAEVAQRMAERAYQSDLSPREQDVLQRVVDGLSNKLIADRLGLTEATVKTHLTHIFEKLGVEDRTQAAIAAVTRGIVRST